MNCMISSSFEDLDMLCSIFKMYALVIFSDLAL